MKKFINIITKKFSNGISIPITSDMLLYLLKSKSPEEVENIDIIFRNNVMRVSGVVKKMKVPFYFTIHLVPEKAENRTILFSIKKLTPINAEWVNKKIFNQPPHVSYSQKYISIDLNQMDKIKALPFGNLKEFEIRGNKLWITIVK